MKRIFTLIITVIAVLGVKAQDISLTITDALWATYLVPQGVDLSQNADLAFFKVSEVKSSTVVLSRIYKAAQGDMVIVHGAEGTYTLTADATAAAIEGNLLRGTDQEAVSDGTYYGLKEIYEQVAFYHVDAGTTIPAGKGYIIVPYGNSVGYTLELDSDGISSPTGDAPQGVMYNMQGMRVDNPTSGLYILNGKKVIIK